MAAWKKQGGLAPFRERLLSDMQARGYAPAFANRLFEQICGFGDYGFPESHAASFALLVYVSAWIKCHYPAAFTCALLNSQPMGFYAPAQLVRDARAHGVAIAGVDVRYSHWDCTLEHNPGAPESPTLRLGLRLVNGLGETTAQRLCECRDTDGPYTDINALARRARIDRGSLRALAEAGALAGLGGHRRQAWWQVLGIEAHGPLLASAPSHEPSPELPAPSEGEDLIGDYRGLGLSLRRHPLALLRRQLRARGFRPATELAGTGHRRIARAAGLVVNRQRPGAAGGVTFLTLEDETGNVNVVIWRDLADRQRPTVIGSRLLGVVGIWEARGEVCHLIAGRLEDHTRLLGELPTRSRDFR
jgi:error-prone DNA polymerase